VATDGQRLTLGDTTLTLYVTPGHTLGTVSILIPVTDGGTPHPVAEWGGTGFNFAVTPERPRRLWFQTYVESAERFREIVARTGADVLISNRSIFDGSRTKLPAVLTRKAVEPHAYVIGNDAVKRFVTVSAE
jgi:metallo-beta-lactamase class B